MLKVFGASVSGHSYKVRLLLSHMDIPHEWHEIDLLEGESHSDEITLRNPKGKVPVLEYSPGHYLTESNAILCFLAENSSYGPFDSWERGKMLDWLFFEQNTLSLALGRCRWIRHFLAPDDAQQDQLPDLQKRCYAGLDVLEQRLSNYRFLAAERYCVADIALFAYTHLAQDAGIDLADYPGVRNWLARIKLQPRYCRMDAAGDEGVFRRRRSDWH